MSVEIKPEDKKDPTETSTQTNEADTSLEDEEAAAQAAQYPCNADDVFECKLIDAVEKNQCIYNRCHPLHKMGDYKLHVWNTIAKDMGFTGPGVELERKWRHMRDRYVRLRKLVKTSQPLRKNDKWFYYYQKMSFLDPYVEHRNRRKRGDLLNNVLNVTTETPDSMAERQDDEASDSGEGEGGDVDPLKGFYASFLNQVNSTNTNGTAPIVEQPSPAPVPAIGPPPSKRIKREWHDFDYEDTEVSLFARSIEKALRSMEPQTFALARVEICRVLYNCQYPEASKATEASNSNS